MKTNVCFCWCLVTSHILFQAKDVHPAKFRTNFHHIPAASAVSLPPELLSTSVREVSGGGVLECSVRCLGMVECLMFGFNSNVCLLWLPNPEASRNLTADLPESGLYVRYTPDLIPLTPQDCADLQRSGLDDDGPFWVFLNGDRWTRVYCDFHTDGGGWTIFQRRWHGGVDFYLNWADYKQGFGDIYKDFWLGNNNLHLLTSQDTYELRVDLWDFGNETACAMYASFSVGDEGSKYILTLGSYNDMGSTAGDSLTYHNNMKFTTKDSDNDEWGQNGEQNCAGDYYGGWWYRSCYHTNLNGLWKSATNGQNVRWGLWKPGPLKSEMKLRPQNWSS